MGAVDGDAVGAAVGAADGGEQRLNRAKQWLLSQSVCALHMRLWPHRAQPLAPPQSTSVSSASVTELLHCTVGATVGAAVGAVVGAVVGATVGTAAHSDRPAVA